MPGKDYVIENGKANMTLQGVDRFILGEIDVPRERSDDRGRRGWVALAAMLAVVWAMNWISSNRHKVDFQQKLDDCFGTHPGWATKYYNARTSEEGKVEVLMNCGFDDPLDYRAPPSPEDN
jgi:hypothetical protein